jgi:hypothetical protein
VKEEILTLVGTLLGRVYERPAKPKVGHVEKRKEKEKEKRSVSARQAVGRGEGRREEEGEGEGRIKRGYFGERKRSCCCQLCSSARAKRNFSS